MLVVVMATDRNNKKNIQSRQNTKGKLQTVLKALSYHFDSKKLLTMRYEYYLCDLTNLIYHVICHDIAGFKFNTAKYEYLYVK